MSIPHAYFFGPLFPSAIFYHSNFGVLHLLWAIIFSEFLWNILVEYHNRGYGPSQDIKSFVMESRPCLQPLPYVASYSVPFLDLHLWDPLSVTLVNQVLKELCLLYLLLNMLSSFPLGHASTCCDCWASLLIGKVEKMLRTDVTL